MSDDKTMVERSWLLAKLDAYFEISARGSSFPQEVRGGLATFLTMSYILLVNPQILTTWLVVDKDHTDLDTLKDDFSRGIATSTALVCGLGCVAVGFMSKMPFAVGPGMGLNTFVAGLFIKAVTFEDVQDAEEVWSLVCTTTFFAGLILTVLSMVGVVSPIITALPETIKTAIMVGIGAYQAFIGFREMGILIDSGNADIIALEDSPNFTWVHRDNVTSGYAQILFILSLMITAVLFAKRVKGSILVGIVFCTAVCWVFGIGGGGIPNPPVAAPDVTNNTFWTIDIGRFFQDAGNVRRYLPQVFVILLVTIFDCGGVQFGVAKLLNLPEKYRAARPRVVLPQDDFCNEVVAASVHCDGDGQEPSDDESKASLMDNASFPMLDVGRPRAGSIIDPEVGLTIEKDAEMKALELQLRNIRKLEEDGVRNLSVAKRNVQKKLAFIQSGQAPVKRHKGAVDDRETQLLPSRSAQLTFVCVGIMDMVAGLFGASPCIIFLECAAGVQEGATTGMASVVTGLFFFLTTFLAPIFQSVPLAASAGPLIFIGCLMMSHVGEIQWHDLTHALPAFFTILLMPFTCSITPGIVSGLVMYVGLRGLIKLYDAVAEPCFPVPPLHKAVREGDIDNVAAALELPETDVNAVDYRENTALHLAVRVGSFDILQALIDAGADPKLKNAAGVTAPDLAKELAAKHNRDGFHSAPQFEFPTE